MGYTKMMLGSAALAAGLILAGGPSARATVINVPGDAADGGIYGAPGGDSSTATVWNTTRDDKMVFGYNGAHFYNIVYVFKLPTLSAGESIQNANLDFYLESISHGTLGSSADLYGIAYRSAPDVILSDWYGGGASDPNATMLQAAIATGNTPTPSTVSTSATGQANLASYLQAQYDAGAKGGNYVFLRLNTDQPNTLEYYYIHPAEMGTGPSLTITTTSAVPEPATLTLLGLAGGMAMLRRRRRSDA